jgi:Bacterial PH domain
MSFVSESLEPGECVTCKAEVSKIAHIGAMLSFAVLLSPMSMLRLARTELALTDRRVIGRSGKKTLKLAHADIEFISVRRGLLGWLLDYGTVVITAKNGASVQFKGIVWPLVFQQELDEAIEVATLGHKLSDFAPPPL